MYKFNNDQLLRLQVMQDYSEEEWQSAYHFLKEGEAVDYMPDGVYVCYDDGVKQLFDGTNSKQGINHIGVVMGDARIGVSLFGFVEKTIPSPIWKKYFIDTNERALNDRQGRENTLRLKNEGDGWTIPMSDYEWLPSVREMYILYLNQMCLNNALDYVGGERMVGGVYWTSTEFDEGHGWALDTDNGQLEEDYRFKPYKVRPVCEF